MLTDLEESGIQDMETTRTAKDFTQEKVTNKKQKRKENMSKYFSNCKSLDFCKPYYTMCHCSKFPNIIKYFNQQ